MNNEEIIWLDDESPYDPLAQAIYSELNLQRYKEYLPLSVKLKEEKSLEVVSNKVKISFKLNKAILDINYLLPDGQLIVDKAEINPKPLLIENSVEEQLLLLITKAETNALLYEKGGDFKLYEQPAVGFFIDTSAIPSWRYKIDELRLRLRMRFFGFKN
jgi:hypothetical protein